MVTSRRRLLRCVFRRRFPHPQHSGASPCDSGGGVVRKARHSFLHAQPPPPLLPSWSLFRASLIPPLHQPLTGRIFFPTARRRRWTAQAARSRVAVPRMPMPRSRLPPLHLSLSSHHFSSPGSSAPSTRCASNLTRCPPLHFGACPRRPTLHLIGCKGRRG
jgi:hypothetical protein